MPPFEPRELKEGNLSPEEVYRLALKPQVEWRPDPNNFCFGKIGLLDIEMQPIDTNLEKSIGVDIYVTFEDEPDKSAYFHKREIGFARVLNEDARCDSNGTEIRDNQAMPFFKRIKEDCHIRYEKERKEIKEDAIAQARRFLLEGKVV